MRHHDKNRTFGRTQGGRTALMRSLAIALIEKGTIITTEAKAKELRGYVEKLVTQGKKDTLAARRVVSSRLGNPKTSVISKLFGDIAKGYAERKGGYTRVTKLGLSAAGRREAVIEFV